MLESISVYCSAVPCIEGKSELLKLNYRCVHYDNTYLHCGLKLAIFPLKFSERLEIPYYIIQGQANKF
jgi:hypothetical protein